MNKLIRLLCICLFFSVHSFAQTSRIYNQPDEAFQEAKQLIQEGAQNLAYPILQQLKQDLISNKIVLSEDMKSWIDFYSIECALHLLLPQAEQDALRFLSEKHHANMQRMMHYHLGHYYHLQQEFALALDCFRKSGPESLTNDQMGNLKFEQAYAYFNQQKFAEAKPFFQEVMQMTSHSYYLASNYYYGFISFSEHHFDEALSAFETAIKAPEYQAVLPYYISEIYYEQGNKDRALIYGDSVLASGANNYYEKDLQLLVGQIYFEKQSYDKALPLIEAFTTKSGKVTREVMYELSFCYYKAGKSDKAIEGFRQLSNEKDSLGQSSMYLLGTLYLNIGDKANARNAFQYCASVNINAEQQESARLNYAKLSGELGFQDIAINEMRSFVKDYPNSLNAAEAKEFLLNLLTATSNYADGIDLYLSIPNPPANLQSVYPQLLFGRAVQLINDQQYAQADTLLGTQLALKSASSLNSYANYWKGEIAYKQKRYDAAIKHMLLFLSSSPKPLGEATVNNGKYTLGYSYFQKGNFKSAMDQFSYLANGINNSSSPLQQDAYLRSSDCSYMLRDYSNASNKYDAIISLNGPQTDYALYQKAMISGIKNAPEKIRLLQALQSRFPESRLRYDMKLEIAQTLVSEKKFSDALPYLNELKDDTEALRHKPAVCQLLGVVYYNLDKNEQALDSYKELFSKYSRSDEAYDALPSVRQIFMDEGNPDGYFKFVSNYGLNLGVNEADSLLFTSAYLKYIAGDCDKAVPGFVKYTSLYTNGVHITDASFYLGQCYLKKNEIEPAVTSFQKTFSTGKSDFYELATLELARLFYFQKKNYDSAQFYFKTLYEQASDNENRLEGLRGLVRTYYQLGRFDNAKEKADELLKSKGVSSDDKIISWMVLAKSRQSEGRCDSALLTYKNIISISKSFWGAEARYESASCYFQQKKFKLSEKAAMSVINETGSYDLWVTKSYLLIGDIFMEQKDYFNAKATYESIFKNANDSSIRQEAERKYNDAVMMESRNGKLKN